MMLAIGAGHRAEIVYSPLLARERVYKAAYSTARVDWRFLATTGAASSFVLASSSDSSDELDLPLAGTSAWLLATRK